MTTFEKHAELSRAAVSFTHSKLESPLKPVLVRLIPVILAIAFSLAVTSLELADLHSAHSDRIVFSGVILTAAGSVLLALFTYLLRRGRQKKIAAHLAALEDALANLERTREASARLQREQNSQ